MSYIYKFTIPNLKYLDLFHLFLENISEIPSNFTLLFEDQISIMFNEPLVESQIISLTNSIENYIPPQSYSIFDSTKTLNISTNQIKSTVYTNVSTSIWKTNPNTDFDINITNMEIVCNLSGPQDGNIIPNVNYSVRLYDALNNNVIFESTNLSNTSIQILTFTNFQNISKNDTVLQLQCKVSSNTYIATFFAAHFTYYKTIS